MPLKSRIAGLAAGMVLALAGAAQAQVGLPSLPGGIGNRLPLAGDIDGRLGQTVDSALRAPARLQALIRRSGGALEADPQGWPVVSGEIVVVDLSSEALRLALEAGFTLVREERFESLGLGAVVLAPPRRLSLARAMERLRRLAPEAEATFNHVHSPAGAVAAATVLPSTSQTGQRNRAAGARMGLIDTGVEAGHAALAGADVRQQGFAGPVREAAHGTAVASLMVGSAGAFRGAEPGAALLVADVYGGRASGGSATALAAALAWMAESGVTVVNVSLVGPRNPLVERAVERARARGLTIVAAVGNDGPAAPPLYPAAYPGVVAVAPVNARNQALPEAGRGDHVVFAAPGADMAAARQGGGFVSVRGASFAAPLAAGLIARRGGGREAIRALAGEAVDLGARGRDPVYGEGLVGGDLRVPPATVRARGRLTH